MKTKLTKFPAPNPTQSFLKKWGGARLLKHNDFIYQKKNALNSTIISFNIIKPGRSKSYGMD